MSWLFHGSKINLKEWDWLKPRVSFDYKSLLYATEDFKYAVVRAGDFNIADIAIKEDYQGKDTIYYLVELRPNAFLDIFDRKGYVYILDKESFVLNNEIEYVSSQPSKIQKKICIDNIWKALQSFPNIKFVFFEDNERYFKEKNIDKEAYMKRRLERIERIKREE